MSPEPALYYGRVMHMRLRPKAHQFRYRVFSLLLDVDHLEEDLAQLRLVGFNRFNLLSFFNRDHGARDGTALRPWVEARLAEERIAPPDTIALLSFPRMFGFAFNPISIFFCYTRGELSSVIYEVKNTFGDQVPYVVRTDDETTRTYHAQAKSMYVSPFIDMDETYRFTLSKPDARFALRIRQGGLQGDTLIATHNAERRKLSDWGVIRACLAHPLMTLKVLAGIHWEALRLFLKGVRFNRYSKSTIWAAKPASE